MLIGRINELKKLNQFYDREGSQVVVVYGQKGIGKKSLISEFIEDKPHQVLRAYGVTELEQRYLWGKELLGNSETDAYPDYTQLFTSITRFISLKKVLVIEDFQNIVKYDPSFIDTLIDFVTKNNDNQEMLVILESSCIGWVENNMIKKIGQAALHLSGLIKIRELSFKDLCAYFDTYTMSECVETYALLGGIPELWKAFDKNKSVQDNIINTILNPAHYLYYYGETKLLEELREPGVYNTILSSLSEGRLKLNDLYLHTGFSRAKISVYLKNLIELELVEKVFSYDGADADQTKKGIYRISNPLLDFYFAFIFCNEKLLNELKPNEYYKQVIAPEFRNFCKKAFAKACAEKIEDLGQKGELPIELDNYGEWMGKEGDIDLIGQDAEGNTLLIKCNWEKPMFLYEDYEKLIKLARLAKISTDHIYLFSGTAFDERVNLEAKIKDNVTLFDLTAF